MQSLSVAAPILDEYCRKWKMSELAMGRPDPLAPNVISLYVRFDPTAEWSLVDRIEMQEELQAIVGKPVRIQSRHAALVRRGHTEAMRVVYHA